MRGRNSKAWREGVVVEDIPRLLQMQVHCGLAGLGSTFLWFAYIGHSFPQQAAAYASRLGIGFVSTALLLFFVAIWLPGKATRWLEDGFIGRARIALRACSVVCVVAIFCLMAVTGGASSPFAALYAMTHTLTLTSVRRGGAPWRVFLLFTAGLVAAAVAHDLMPVLAPAEMAAIQNADVSTWVQILFGGVLAYVVSTASYTYALSRDIEVQRERLSEYFAEHNFRWRVRIAREPVMELGSTSNRAFGQTQSTIVFNTRDSFLTFAARPSLWGIAHLYLRGGVDIDGDWWEALAVIDRLPDRPQAWYERLGAFVYNRVVPIVLRVRSRTEHYQIKPEVYEIFLGKHMQYTCGLFDATHGDIDRAQDAKFKLIRDLTNLQPQAYHVDIGCGWGGLVRYFAEEWQTVSVGVTDAGRQAAYAEQNNHRTGQTSFHLGDFATFRAERPVDVFTVVGMLEHLPEGRHAEFFDYLYKHLAPGGFVYLQCITRSPRWRGGDRTRFLNRHIFPHHFLATPAEIERRASRAGFNTIKRLEHSTHYAATTRCWVTALRTRADEVVQLIGDDDFRRLVGYLSLGAFAFEDGRGALHRFLLQKPE